MWSISTLTLSAMLLPAGSALNVAINLMFTARRFFGWFDGIPSYLAWERGMLMVAYVAAALGVSILEIRLRDTGGGILATMGATAFLIGVVLALAAETAILAGQGSTTPLVAAMVVVLFVAEAMLGGALAASGLPPAWISWTVVAWSLGAPVFLGLFSPGDIYYPVAHFAPLVLIGISLLMLS
jgi:hypothetical protein